MASGEQRDYSVHGMTCNHCKGAGTAEVTRVPGVASVDVDLDTKLVRVRGTEMDEAALVAAIDEAGYEAVTAGRYRLFLQCKHEGRVQTAAFTQEVR